MRDISVIIPARNASGLHSTLASLENRENRSRLSEILIVGPAECCAGKHAPEVRFLPTPTPVTAPVARNLGIRSATASWLAFIDADCVADPGWLARLSAAATRERPVVGGGVGFKHAGYWSSVHNVSMLHAYHTSARPGARRFLPTLNLLVHQDVVAKVGVMDEALRRAQDLEWTGRMDQAGIALWFEPGAVVVHAPERDASSLWRDYFETAKVSYHARQKLGLPAPFPRWLRSSAKVKTLSPLVALAAALSLFAHNPALLPYLYCLPGIWYTKLAWCLGAAEQMRK